MTERRALPTREEVRRIGCLMLNGIGDILCVTPMLEALKERYPEAQLTMMIRPHLRALVEGNPFVDKLIFYDTARSLKRLVFLWEVRRQKFDLWIDLHVPTFNTVFRDERDLFRNAFLMRASGATYQLAYAVPQLRRYLSHPVPLPQEHERTSTNIVDTTLALIDPGPKRRYKKHMPISDSNRAWAERVLAPRHGPRIGLFIGGRQSAKIWPQRRVMDFVALLFEEIPDAELVLLGDEHETALAEAIVSSFSETTRSRVRNLVCKADLGQMAAALERCRAVVSTDSGPMHIADAGEIPMVVLFSSHNWPAIWRPMNPNARVINHPVECGPCFQATCHLGNKCMDLIDPREALDALLQVLKR